ncbi:ketopantoate reductase family protein [Eubacteriaceae bacterium ES3]|nr:ketopantoate reductase family protein [Eubacteriaceae bacterium ES3]
MEIQKVSIIGLGALGILFGHQIAKNIGSDFSVIADQQRIEKYKSQGVFCNSQVCEFSYQLPEEEQVADLIIFSVKYDGLEDAIQAAQNHVDEKTIFISLLNGIISENVIAETFGDKNLIWSVALGMDTIKEGNRLTYTNPGMICFGEQNGNDYSPKVKAVKDFFNRVGIVSEINDNMEEKIWSKFMLNVGINQVVAVYGQDFGSVQKPGELRDMMIAAMREVIPVAECEGVKLSEEDIFYWLDLIDSLDCSGKPSMRQDVEAKRKSEVDLFSGTVLKLSRKHGIASPVNKDLFEKIKALESDY